MRQNILEAMIRCVAGAQHVRRPGLAQLRRVLAGAVRQGSACRDRDHSHMYKAGWTYGNLETLALDVLPQPTDWRPWGSVGIGLRCRSLHHPPSSHPAVLTGDPRSTAAVAPPSPQTPPLRAPHNIQSQLSEVFKIIVYCDYPGQWPGLLESLYGNLSAQVRATARRPAANPPTRFGSLLSPTRGI